MDHRSSTGVDRRGSTRYSIQNDLSDDEDYALAAMGISDGFRPSDLGHNRMSSQTSQHHDRRTSNAHPYRELQSVPIPPPRPSSTSKPKYDSFALRHDGAMGPITTSNAAIASSSNAMPSRSSSVSTNIPLRPESPYRGPTGPSHPYGMYPQESRLARTASMATTSTAPIQERSYAGPSGPTHPYGMYPQNTVPETESVNGEPGAAPVPVGFPGLNNNYQRRLGPEGEEIADIIGPDGHTEQLPPYTQYPDEAFARKTRPVVQLPDSGAGGIGLATRNPEFESREDLNSPDSRMSSRSLTLADSGPQINMAAAEVSEKPPLKNWQKFAKRKICGVIPTWAIILAGCVLVIFGIVLGSVFAALKPKHPPKSHHVDGDGNAQSVVYTTMTTTFDATPFTTVPTGLPSLPTGIYALPIMTPSTQQAGCLQNSAQSNAWTCSIQPALPYQLDVQGIPASSPLSDNEITLSYGNNTVNYLPYGAQPPILNQAQVLGLVTDSQDPERGPAWFFQAPYNKIVVLPESMLSFSNDKRQAVVDQSTSDFMQRKGTAQPGDMPWVCYWNGTLLETFIYVTETSSYGAHSSSSCSTTATSTGYGGGATATYGSSAQTSDASSGTSSYSNPNFLSAYPKVIKVEERRVPKGYQTIPPYCIQHVVNGDGTTEPALNSTGQPITIYLNETEPTTISPISDRSTMTLFKRLEERDRYLNERDSSQSCGCVWLST